MITSGDEQLGVLLARDIMAARAAIARLLARLRGQAAEPPGHAESADHAPFAFPVMLDVRARRVVIAGGGREAAQKAEALARLGALVTVWAPVHTETTDLQGRLGAVLTSGPFDDHLLVGALLAIIGTGDRELDRRIATRARARGVLVNTVDDIPYCDWSAPAILRRGDLTIAVATAAIAPALAVRLRDQLAVDIGPEYGALLEAFGAVRPQIMASGRPFADRRRLWYDLVDGPALDHLRAGKSGDARQAIDAAISSWEAGQ